MVLLQGKDAAVEIEADLVCVEGDDAKKNDDGFVTALSSDKQDFVQPSWRGRLKVPFTRFC